MDFVWRLAGVATDAPGETLAVDQPYWFVGWADVNGLVMGYHS